MKFGGRNVYGKYLTIIFAAGIISIGLLTASISGALTGAAEEELLPGMDEELRNNIDFENESMFAEKRKNSDDRTKTRLVKITSEDAVEDANGNYVINIASANQSAGAMGADMVMDGGIAYRKITFEFDKSKVDEGKPLKLELSAVAFIPEKEDADIPEMPAVFFGNAIYRSSDGVRVDMNALLSGLEYYFYIPVNDTASSYILRCRVSGSFENLENEQENISSRNMISYITVNITKRFDLG